MEEEEEEEEEEEDNFWPKKAMLAASGFALPFTEAVAFDLVPGRVLLQGACLADKSPCLMDCLAMHPPALSPFSTGV